MMSQGPNSHSKLRSLCKDDDLWRAVETVWTEINPEGHEDGKA